MAYCQPASSLEYLPRYLYRVTDSHSVGTLVAGDAFAPFDPANDQERASEIVENHIDWGNREPTPLISVTDSRGQALRYAEGRLQNFKSDVKIWMIDCRELQRACVTVYHMVSLADILDIHIPHKAWNFHEHVIVSFIPESAAQDYSPSDLPEEEEYSDGEEEYDEEDEHDEEDEYNEEQDDGDEDEDDHEEEADFSHVDAMVGGILNDWGFLAEDELGQGEGDEGWWGAWNTYPADDAQDELDQDEDDELQQALDLLRAYGLLDELGQDEDDEGLDWAFDEYYAYEARDETSQDEYEAQDWSDYMEYGM